MDVSPEILRMKNGRPYFPVSFSYFSFSDITPCVCGEEVYTATTAQWLLSTVGTSLAAAIGAFLCFGAIRLQLAVSHIGVLSLVPFAIFALVPLTGVLRWLPFRLLPWKRCPAGTNVFRKQKQGRFLLLAQILLGLAVLLTLLILLIEG